MAAVVRGGTHYAAKARASAGGKSPGRAQAGRGRAPARPADYAPGKLRAAKGIGLRPGLALAASAAVGLAVLAVAMFTGDRLQRAGQAAAHTLGVQMADIGFKVAAVHVQGASPQAKVDVLRASGLYRDQPILDLDLEALRSRVARVGWVKDARVVRLLPDTLVITITERPAAAVWQFNRRARVVDDKGQVIPEADAGRYSDLPLVVGSGAAEAAPELLPLIRARPRLAERLEALVRVDDRRWDVRLKDGGLIQLPAGGEESALIQLDRLDREARVLELGFARIDLRDPELVAVRPREGAAVLAEPAPVAGV